MDKVFLMIMWCYLVITVLLMLVLLHEYIYLPIKKAIINRYNRKNMTTIFIHIDDIRKE